MPVICSFFGIDITMYYRDHAPPHFHARFGGRVAVIGIDPPRLLHGGLPPRALGMVFEWATLHAGQLQRDWELARADRPLERIEPLQ